jgi:hypothetical protein
MTNRHLPFVGHQTTLNNEHIAGCLPLVCKLQYLAYKDYGEATVSYFREFTYSTGKCTKTRKKIRSVLCPILYESREPLKIKPEAPSHEPNCRSYGSAYGCVRSEAESQSRVAATNESISRSRCQALLRLMAIYVIMFCNAHED